MPSDIVSSSWPGLSNCPSQCQSESLLTHLPVCVSPCLCMLLCLCMCVALPVCQTVCLSVLLSVCMSVCLCCSVPLCCTSAACVSSALSPSPSCLQSVPVPSLSHKMRADTGMCHTVLHATLLWCLQYITRSKYLQYDCRATSAHQRQPLLTDGSNAICSEQQVTLTEKLPEQASFWRHLPATLASLKAALAKQRDGVKLHTPATPEVTPHALLCISTACILSVYIVILAAVMHEPTAAVLWHASANHDLSGSSKSCNAANPERRSCLTRLKSRTRLKAMLA